MKTFVGILLLIIVSSNLVLGEKNQISTKKDKFFPFNDDSLLVKDTFYLKSSDFTILENDSISLRISIIDTNNIALLLSKITPVLKFKINNLVYIAKGNHIFSSFVPYDCDYFYAFDLNGKIIFHLENQISFHYIRK